MPETIEKVRVVCNSTNWEEFCLMTLHINSKYTFGEPLDRCKGMGCKGRNCPTSFLVSVEQAKELEKQGVVIAG